MAQGEEFREVAKVLSDLERIDDTATASFGRIQRAAGMAAKGAALSVAADKLGGDRHFSGWRTKASLGAGFDTQGRIVQLNLRPGGMWTLAEKGRKASDKRVVPRKRSGRKAILTPWGPRASARVGASRGLNAITDTVAKAADESHRAASHQIGSELRRAVT